MRRVKVVLAMVVALLAAQAANGWYFLALERARAEFNTLALEWLVGVLLFGASTLALGIGWLVLRAPQADPIVGSVHALVGACVLFAVPMWIAAGWAVPSWLLESSNGLALTRWLGAAFAAIGLAELIRWLATRSRPVGPRSPAWGPTSESQPSR